MNKIKRISSLIGVILIASMYVISLISAIFATEQAPGLFLASIFSTITIPIMIHGFLVIYKRVHKDKEMSKQDTNEEEGN
ncbi:MAG: hypothetical protein GX288_06030 [Clostridiales bacterium]|nr:hypothetical protein [Clostridiales bacterium]